MKDDNDSVDELLNQLAEFGHSRLGDAIKEHWFYAGELCPGCMKRKAGSVKYKGKNAVSLNCYFYRERGILMGYLLCGPCARKVLRKSRESAIHKTIEWNLVNAYHFDGEDDEGMSGKPS